jgi:phosphoglycolate phosphatase
MDKRYRLVIFDWEGTLGDTLGDVLSVLANEAERLEYGRFDDNVARQYVSFGLDRAVKKLFPHLSLSQLEDLLHAVQQALITSTGNVCLIPGAMQIIQNIHDLGIGLAIATNKGHQSLQRVLQASGLNHFFKVTRSAGQVPAKPCPQMLEEILQEFDLQASQALMIGDSIADIEMAVSIGMDAIGVDFYHQQKEALHAAGALEVFDEYQQVARYLQLPER